MTGNTDETRLTTMRKILTGIFIATLSLTLTACDEEFGTTGPGQDLDSLTYAKNVGMTWVRIFVRWDTTNPQPYQVNVTTWGSGGNWCPSNGGPTCNWPTYSLAEDVRYAKAKGFRVLVVLHRTPRWSSGCGDNKTDNECRGKVPGDPSHFAGYVSEVLRQVPTIDALAFWNEPDNPNPSTVKWAGSKQEFRDYILKPGYLAAKAMNPNVIIVGPNTARARTPAAMDSWLRDDVTNQLVPIDVVGMNLYGKVATINDVTDTFVQYAIDRHIPGFWITEFGWGGSGSTCPKVTTGNIANKILAVRSHVRDKNAADLPVNVKAFQFAVNNRQRQVCVGLQQKDNTLTSVYSGLLAYQNQIDADPTSAPVVSYTDDDYLADNPEDGDGGLN